jgi:hypothetical protein
MLAYELLQVAWCMVPGTGCWMLGAISLSETSPFEGGRGDVLGVKRNSICEYLRDLRDNSSDFGFKQLFLH